MMRRLFHRRFVHLVLLLLIVMGVRRYGGATEAEDRLRTAGRWAGEEAGLVEARKEWNTTARPRVAASKTTLSNAIHTRVAAAMESAATSGGIAGWITDELRTSLQEAESLIRSILAPNPGPARTPNAGDRPPLASAVE